jgi:hypothetical protein
MLLRCKAFLGIIAAQARLWNLLQITTESEQI